MRSRREYNNGFDEDRRAEYNALGAEMLAAAHRPIQGATGPHANLTIFQRCSHTRPPDIGVTVRDFTDMKKNLLSGKWTFESVYEHILAMLAWIEKGELDPYREIRAYSKELVNDASNQTGI